MMNTSQIQGCLLLTKSVHEKGRRMSFKGLETGLRRLSLTWFVLLALTQSSVGQEAVGAQRLRIIRIQFGSLLVSFVPGDMIIDDRAIHFDPGSPKNSFELQLSDVAEIQGWKNVQCLRDVRKAEVRGVGGPVHADAAGGHSCRTGRRSGVHARTRTGTGGAKALFAHPCAGVSFGGGRQRTCQY